MSNVSRLPAPEIDRKAQAVAEISQLYAALEESTRITEEQARTIIRQQDRIDMLEAHLTEERERSRICERKLIRLASNQRNISRIAQDGDEIMRSVQDWDEVHAESNESDVHDILKRCPTIEADQPATIPPANSI